jgi:hypothetical protein
MNAMITQPTPNRRHLTRRFYQLSRLRVGSRSVVVLLLGVALLFAGCDSGPNGPELSGRADDTGTTLKMGRDNGTVTVPFKAEFFTELVSLMPDDACGAPPNFLNTQKGFGEATHLGRFSAQPTFCINMADLLDGQLTEGESLPFGPSEEPLIAANGDELWVASSSGEVVPSDHPDVDFEFTIQFEITGGTGRFEGASGGGVQHGFVDQQASRTQHQWSGTLSLPRER